jgi:hypothetical protein
MDKQKLLELAERVEKASGPDRELDQEICRAVGPCKYQPDGTWITYFEGGYSHSINPLPVTASLDAAMTLVPDGYGFQAKLYSESSNESEADVWKGCDYDPIHSAEAANPALALTAAALRARAGMGEG